MADYADSTSKDRGRRPDPRDEDHTRDPSPDRAETPEQRGRKSRDNQEDHEREFSHKELAQREDHKGQNWGNNQRWQGQDRRGYGRGHEQYYDQNSQYYQRGRGHHPQQGPMVEEVKVTESTTTIKTASRDGMTDIKVRTEKGDKRAMEAVEGDGIMEETDKIKEIIMVHLKDEDPVVFLSKKLSFILRHGAEKMGFKMMPGGFLWVDEILRRNEYRDFTVEDIKHIVETNDKQRFSLADENGRLKIRANQGHSVEVDGLELTPIKDPSEAPEVIHGTYLKSWDIIKNQGLNKMGRNHIHFAAGEPGENGVISGMRSSCEVIIKLNMEKALKDGLKFFRSANNVILSPGDADGFIRPCYFDSAFQRYPRGILPFNSEIKEGPTIPGLSGDLVKGKKKKNKKKHKEDQEGEKVKKEKSETGEQEVNMEGATSMFSEESTEGADQETEKTVPQASENVPDAWDESDKSNNATNHTPEDRLPSDDGTQDRPSIPGLSGDLANQDKKNKRKNKSKKNSEAAMKETNMAAPQTKENVPDTWDESDKSNDATNPTPDKLLEITPVGDEDCCRSAVEELKSTGPVFVYCHLKGEEVTYVVCVSKSCAFNFKTELLAKGDLREFLNDASTEAKIFNSIADTSEMLFDKYSIMLDGTNVYSNKVAYDYVKDRNLGNFNELPQGFDPKDWGSLAVGPELLKKCKVSLQAYKFLSR
uniref:2'-phosphotransferase n=1 Tax=Magallana gigas TaxID=29159 RepID=A0A8W8IA52_MAGGI